MAEIPAQTDESLSQLLEASTVPVLVDFWAPWCSPCVSAAPIMEELSAELAGRLAFAKINVDEFQAAAAKLKITRIPCFVVFKDGEEIKRILGLKSKKDYLEQLETVI
jgi:thioredoxin 1